MDGQNKNHANCVPLIGPAHINQSKRQKLVNKGKRSKYSVTPDKRNIVEIQRSMNKKKLAKHPKNVHCEKLHDLQGKRIEAKVQMKTEKDAEHETQQQNYPYKPEMSETSKLLMGKTEEDVIQRNDEWNQQKYEKRRVKQEIKEQEEIEKEEQAKEKEILRKKEYYAESKVKKRIEETMDVNQRRRSNSHKYKNRSVSPYGRK